MRAGTWLLIAVLLGPAAPAAAVEKPAPVRVQALGFHLQSPLPVPVTIRILGPAPDFPQVLSVPAAPGSVQVPYPESWMQVQVRIAPGVWSHVVTLTRRPTIQRLPILF